MENFSIPEALALLKTPYVFKKSDIRVHKSIQAVGCLGSRLWIFAEFPFASYGFHICGGAALDLLLSCVSRINKPFEKGVADVDLFYVGKGAPLTKEIIINFLRDVQSYAESTLYPGLVVRLIRTISTITVVFGFVNRPVMTHIFKMQIILSTFKSVDHVLESFDMGASMISWGDGVFRTNLLGLHAFTSGKNYVFREKTSTGRAAKYEFRGFRTIFLGTPHSLIEPMYDDVSFTSEESLIDTIISLFSKPARPDLIPWNMFYNIREINCDGTKWDEALADIFAEYINIGGHADMRLCDKLSRGSFSYWKENHHRASNIINIFRTIEFPFIISDGEMIKNKFKIPFEDKFWSLVDEYVNLK